NRDHDQVLFNDKPLERILVSGSVAKDRPFREYVTNMKDDRIQTLQHPGYGVKYDDNSTAIVRTRYYKELSRYLCGFCDGHAYRYIHLKNFEIASVGSLLLADRLVEREMGELGFVDRETCLFSDRSDFLSKVDWMLDPQNRQRVDEIRRAGMELVRD